MTPYYQQDGVTIYHGDCRDLLPTLTPVDSVITDPVWPNSFVPLAGSDDPHSLAQAAAHFPRLARRVVVQLGCDTDPRFLSALPASLPFLRVCWLPFAVPNYKGRILYSGDVAYAYGEPPPPRKGRMVLDGECPKPTTPRAKGHPCPRKIEHVRWLVSRFADGTVLDPFCGSGTTLLAAKQLGYPAIGMEVEERYCEHAAKRLCQRMIEWEETDVLSSV